MQLLFLDTETTGNKDGGDRMIQLAYKTVEGKTVNELFKPPSKISYEAMAVHNITEEMLAEKACFEGSECQHELCELVKDHIVIAHNAAYDLGVLRTEGVFANKYICTFKVAHQHMEKDRDGNPLSGRSLQYLRYALDLDEIEATAHDAWGDIIILEKLFYKLLQHVGQEMPDKSEEEIIEYMADLSTKPILIKQVRFGKHKGKTWEQVAIQEPDYILWLARQDGNDENMRYTLRHYIQEYGLE